MNILIALGGNALGDTPQEQKVLVQQTAKNIVDLIEVGHLVTIVHGNGPQVGMIQNAFDFATSGLKGSPDMPLAECVAMSQGYIGVHLQNAIANQLKKRNINRSVATILTQTVVDASDPAFIQPSKPIGPFYDEELASKIAKEKGLSYIEDSGRGYRIVVPSPEPISFVEIEMIQYLVDNKGIVIAAGGGGVPVIDSSSGYQPINAVIDKDKSSAKLAELLDSDIFMILTAVERVMLNFGLPNQKSLDRINLNEAKEYIREGHFGKGSMLPKIEAAISFVSAKPNSQAIIADLSNVALAIKGESGTVLYHG